MLDDRVEPGDPSRLRGDAGILRRTTRIDDGRRRALIVAAFEGERARLAQGD